MAVCLRGDGHEQAVFFVVAGRRTMSKAITSRTQMITARLPLELARRLTHTAAQRNQRVTEIVAEALEEKLNQENQRQRNEQTLDAQAA